MTPVQEAWSEKNLNAPGEDSLGCETQTDDTWDSQQDEEEATNDLALPNHFNLLLVGEKHRFDGSNNIDPFALAREVVTSFEEKNIVVTPPLSPLA